MKPPPVTKTMTGAGAVRFAGTENKFYSFQYFFVFRLKPLRNYFSLIHAVQIPFRNYTCIRAGEKILLRIFAGKKIFRTPPNFCANFAVFLIV